MMKEFETEESKKKMTLSVELKKKISIMHSLVGGCIGNII